MKNDTSDKRECEHIRWEDGNPHETHNWVTGAYHGRPRPTIVCHDCHIDIEDDEALLPCAARSPVQTPHVVGEDHPVERLEEIRERIAEVERIVAAHPDSKYTSGQTDLPLLKDALALIDSQEAALQAASDYLDDTSMTRAWRIKMARAALKTIGRTDD
jgi:hypothetical protein